MFQLRDSVLPQVLCVRIFYSVTRFCSRLMHFLLVFMVSHEKEISLTKSFILSGKVTESEFCREVRSILCSPMLRFLILYYYFFYFLSSAVVHCVSKTSHLVLSISLPIINRFSEFFHRHTFYTVANKVEYPATP